MHTHTRSHAHTHTYTRSKGRMIRSKSNTRSSDSRVSDVSNCSRLLEHPSAASQYNVVHSHFLPYVPTTTAAHAAASPAPATASASAAAGAVTTNAAIPAATSGVTVTTTYVSSPGTAPVCGMAATATPPGASKF